MKVTVSVNYNAGAIDTKSQSTESRLAANYIGPVTPITTTKGQFSVSSSKKVTFAKGNLQYIGSTNTWRIAENQYDYFGTTYNPIGDTTGNWDLFRWSNNATYSNYGVNNCVTQDNTGFFRGSFKNWGDLPSIAGQGWTVLTKDEWNYLFGTNSGRGTPALWDGATITDASDNTYQGIVILPDDYSGTPGFTRGRMKSYPTITNAQRVKLEQAGAVFLPAAGYRYYQSSSLKGESIENVGSMGYYWSSTTASTAGSAHLIYFSSSALSQGASTEYQHNGCAVRLVRTVTTTSSK